MIRVAAGLCRKEGRLLVCQRSAAGTHPGKWEFPGGKVEPGETPAEALRRELREELGIEAEVGALVWTTRHRYPGREPVELSFFVVESVRGEITNRVFTSIRWAEAGALSTLDFLEADRELVERLERGALPPGSDTGGM